MDYLKLVQEIPLPGVLIAFAITGLCLLAILIRQTRENNHFSLKRHRSKNPGVADLLNWAAVIDDGIIVNKDGSLMAAWLYRGNDNSSATNSERNAVSHYINAALNGLGSGWMIHVDAIRRPSPAYSNPAFSHFPDPVSLAIDEERRSLFSHLHQLYEGCFVLTATYFPPLLAQAKFVELMFDDPEGVSTHLTDRGRKIVDDFKRDINSLQGRLSTALSLERLRGHRIEEESGGTIIHDDFLRWLHFCLTGQNNPVVLPKNPAYIDTLVGGQDMTGGMIPLIGNKYVMVIGIDNFPFESSPASYRILPNCRRISLEHAFHFLGLSRIGIADQ